MSDIDEEDTDSKSVPGTGIAHEFARRVHAMSAADLTPEVLRWARVGVLDTIGVTLAGSREPAVHRAAAALDLADGPALRLGTRRRIGALDAALLNGTASHALDFDDCNNTMGGHPSAPVLSALLPLADQLASTGEDFLVAYVAGFELECKLGLAINFHHYTKGWHPTATLGTFGAAAACARLMTLDAAQTATALALAASFASGIKANFGTMAKPLHVGHAARNGLLAARLARAGMTASSERAFEHEHGFLDVFNGPGTYDVARALAAWAEPMDIVDPGIAIKQYPCCGSTHPAIDAMLGLVREHGLRADEVATVEAWVHRRRLQHTDRPSPRSALDAKFSLQYVLARALADGCVALHHFENEAHADARVHALLPRIRVTPYDETRFAPANHFGGAVRLTLVDGRVLEASVEQALGRTSANPLPVKQLRDKFRLCAATVLQADAIASLTAQIESIIELPDLRELTGALARATTEPAA
ncbi:MAG: MmgE/PrpD family protein [Pseudomonadota bacterium]|nr:MmgE/PrpD family protein [Pseudomonadota bacterium]